MLEVAPVKMMKMTQTNNLEEKRVENIDKEKEKICFEGMYLESNYSLKTPQKIK